MEVRVAILLALLALTFGCGGTDETPTEECGPAHATVERVVDGDTIVLVGGQKVRYLGVNAPESDACFGPEAEAFNAALVVGREVGLEYDVQCRDQYDRLLAHVTLDGGSVNLTLLEQGLACLMVIAPNVLYEDVYAQAVQVARAYGRGIWEACEPVPCL